MEQEGELRDFSKPSETLKLIRTEAGTGSSLVVGINHPQDLLTQVFWLTQAAGTPGSMRLTERHMNPTYRVNAELFDPHKPGHAGRIVFSAMARVNQFFTTNIVSNGPQTESIQTRIADKPYGETGAMEAFEDATSEERLEQLLADHTPLIAAATFQRTNTYAYTVIHHAAAGKGGRITRRHGSGSLSNIPAGTGFYLHAPQPDDTQTVEASQIGPFAVPIPAGETAEATAGIFWDRLNPRTRVALVAKVIDRRDGLVDHHVINA